MAIITRKPRNSSLRFQSYVDTSDITRHKPERSLVATVRRQGGRNSYGRITTRHHGGGALKKYRIVDFKRAIRDIPAKLYPSNMIQIVTCALRLFILQMVPRIMSWFLRVFRLAR